MINEEHFTHADEYRENSAWRQAKRWQEKVRQSTRPVRRPGILRMTLTWIACLFTLMVAGILGLIFSLIGLALIPLIRHRVKRRMENLRAEQAEDVTPGFSSRPSSSHSSQVWEGQYEIKHP
ncbi:hypothetical protein [Halomonas binhaiensis]|uniref:DUF3742 family protein n=1 Tax=Halomonas binhaiensis TaxID=2562282 RepID=A0A5C1NLL6_9GAMM|nr:hypothetical protein [Halomonas binhaiensis]QEM83307.1 hypothetical protein E4T21_18410 [Halomonas binhaiensis]